MGIVTTGLIIMEFVIYGIHYGVCYYRVRYNGDSLQRVSFIMTFDCLPLRLTKLVPHRWQTYQIYMAWGDHRQQSAYTHIESTFDHEEYMKLSQLLHRVDGNVTAYTVLKFKVRAAAAGKGHVSNFSQVQLVNLHIISGERFPISTYNTLSCPIVPRPKKLRKRRRDT